jgi:hypothetical protein
VPFDDISGINITTVQQQPHSCHTGVLCVTTLQLH